MPLCHRDRGARIGRHRQDSCLHDFASEAKSWRQFHSGDLVKRSEERIVEQLFQRWQREVRVGLGAGTILRNGAERNGTELGSKIRNGTYTER